ncbi:eukaryotic translation initiation factor 1A, putative [Eimeria acervulina]|uniref:Eukaryotic translation initiation factor 1A, putative n=1 Tax=Eimeria acervulina TaxID=5801 RepID=U6GAD8_EIMAC|nr:eukaryotic translation initiation factor 1A, putative [Eimeria acervulina]CDI77080.1 eukaryotic translation initiation factor 1A, putative [Eimeria acervulina]
MRKRVWVNAGDIVLVSLREFQDNKGDVIAKYTPDEARALKSYGELPANAKINETDAFGDDEGGGGGIEFQESGSGSGSGSESEDANDAQDLDVDDVGVSRSIISMYLARQQQLQQLQQLQQHTLQQQQLQQQQLQQQQLPQRVSGQTQPY